MDKKEAVDMAVEKWKGLVSGETRIMEALAPCSLCKFATDCYAISLGSEACSRCPLDQAGCGCLHDGGHWDQINKAFVPSNDNYTKTVLDYDGLVPHVDAIYKALVKIQKEIG